MVCENKNQRERENLRTKSKFKFIRFFLMYSWYKANEPQNNNCLINFCIHLDLFSLLSAASNGCVSKIHCVLL